MGIEKIPSHKLAPIGTGMAIVVFIVEEAEAIHPGSPLHVQFVLPVIFIFAENPDE